MRADRAVMTSLLPLGLGWTVCFLGRLCQDMVGLSSHMVGLSSLCLLRTARMLLIIKEEDSL